MSPLAITWLVFTMALLAGGYAHYRSARHSHHIDSALRQMMRIGLGLSVFMAVWACSAYALWLAGVPLEIGSIDRGVMGQHWWVGPLCLMLAAVMYYQLRQAPDRDDDQA